MRTDKQRGGEKMDQGNRITDIERSDEILADRNLADERLILAEYSGDCDRYGCNCINYEKCGFFGC